MKPTFKDVETLEKPLPGGTGHTIKVCKENDIPILNQEVYMAGRIER